MFLYFCIKINRKFIFMNNKTQTSRIVAVASIIILAAAMRLIPHWPNFTPIAAIALFGGTMLTKKWMAFIIPIGAMFISDLIIGMHGYMFAVYISFFLTVFLGTRISKNPRFANVLGTSVASSLLFFIITNFAVWLGSPFYAQSFAGLITCYSAGLPFFNDGSLGISFLMNGLIGDLFFNGIFFGAFYLASRRIPALSRV